MLSFNRPVGVMIYGNAKLGGVGGETLIKLYRMERCAIPKPTKADLERKFVMQVDRYGKPTIKKV